MNGPALLMAIVAAATPSRAADPCASPGRASLDATFVRDMSAKDFGVLRLYTPDAVFINPDRSKVRTPSGLRKLYRTVFATYDSDLRLKPARITALPRGECIEEGAYEEDLRTRATGQVQHARGAYRFTARKGANGHWRFSRMQWLND